jgi:uncharacterized protein (TIGR03118 family)
MKTKLFKSGSLLLAGALLIAFAPLISLADSGTPAGYAQVNRVSDGATNSARTDTRLVNPWGLVAGPGAVWVNDNGAGLTTGYHPSGQTSDFAIQIPPPAGSSNSAGTPTGLVFNDKAQFLITNGTLHGPATFLVATEDGTICAWNRSVTGSNAVIVVDNSGSGAVYKGLAIACATNGTPQLYAANFHAGTIDVFDENFQFVQSFADTNLPAFSAPFNVKTIRGLLFVTFAIQKQPDLHDDLAGAGNGSVDIFDTDGALLRSFATGGVLNSPWGLAVAPANFGAFSHALLVGNFGDGKINAFNLVSGKSLGNLTQTDGTDLVIDGLWGLTFDQQESAGHECDFDSERLYFTAGLNGEADGLFGYVHFVAHKDPPKDNNHHEDGQGQNQGHGHGHGQNH